MTNEPYLLIDNLSGYLRLAGIPHDRIEGGGGDVTTLKGVAVVEHFGETHFTVSARNNGIFIDYTDPFGRSFIKKIED
jgi:hypothetical protein